MQTWQHISTLAALAALIMASGTAWSSPDATAGNGAIEIYFTTPGVSPETAEDPAADDALLALIGSATDTLDVCLYDFKHVAIADAVIDAHERGVAVRFVGDLDEYDQYGYQALSQLGVPMVLRGTSGIMHNKFLVVDGRWVTSGSMNFSDAGVYWNNNNLVIIDDGDLATAYTLEFEQMFIDGRFGGAKLSVPQSHWDFGDTELDLAFSPQDDVELLLRSAIATADHSVYGMIFAFSRQDVAQDLISKHEAGVEVLVVYDTLGASQSWSTDDTLAAAGVPVMTDGNGNAHGSSGGKLHHKVMLIDAGTDSDPMVVIGSYNWSGAASNVNDENMLILYGEQAVAPFLAELCRVYDAAIPHPTQLDAVPDPCATPAVAGGLRINELLPNPDGTDGPEEYIELVNTGDDDVDLAGYSVGDLYGPRHVFGSATLAPGAATVVYGGANAGEPDRVTASSGGLSLNNSSETITLWSPTNAVIDVVSYSTSVSGVALNRVDDGGVDGPFARHDVVSPTGATRSPGTRADGTAWQVAEPAVAVVIINELLPNPEGTDLGQEFVELVNAGTAVADLSGWRLGDTANDARHVFPDGTWLAPGAALVVYDRGDHADVANAVVSSTGTLSLNNSNETVTLIDAGDAVIDTVAWTSSTTGVSKNRAVDAEPAAGLVDHDVVAGAVAAQSPGTRVDGTTFDGTDGTGGDNEPVLTEVTVTESGTVLYGEWAVFGPFEAASGAFDVAMTGTGDADLYVREGAAPTSGAWDCRPYHWGSSESCNAPAPGSFYVAVHGYEDSTFALTVTYTTITSTDETAEVAAPQIVVESLLADPAGTDLGQEFLVLRNLGEAAVDLGGFKVSDAASVRHEFTAGTTLAAGEAVTLFDRGDHPGAILASTTRLSLNNSGDTITITDASGEAVDAIVYDSAPTGHVLQRGLDF